MKVLEFERLDRGTYKASLHADGYSIPVGEEVLALIKDNADLPVTAFFDLLIERIGYNRYLKTLIKTSIEKAQDPTALHQSLLHDLTNI